MEILEEILLTGNIQPQYVHSKYNRIRSVCCTTLFAVICCFPCLVWDTLNYFTKNKYCRWGLSYSYIRGTLQATYIDKRGSKLETITKKDILPHHLYDVAIAYLRAFDLSINNRDAKRANIIRGELVYLLTRYSHYYLLDDGDIDNLRIVIDQLRI